METEHTPGPWYFQQVGTPGYFVIKGPNLNPLRETVENARLKAAAPDLLVAARIALQLIRDTWIEDHGSEQVGDAWGALESAIKKATT